MEDDPHETQTRLLQRFVSISAGAEGYSGRHFTRASAALTELQRRIEAHEATPPVIIVDGELTQDQAPLNRGPEFIRQTRTLAGLRPPTFVAFSSAGSLNEQMLATGATEQFHKDRPILEYREKLRALLGLGQPAA